MASKAHIAKVTMTMRSRMPLGGGIGRQRIPNFKSSNPIEAVARSFVAGQYSFAGKDYDRINALLQEPIQGVEVRQEEPESDKMGAYSSLLGINNSLDLANEKFIAEAVASAMQGHELSAIQKSTLSRHMEWLELPTNLRDYAVAVMQLAELYGKPGAAIEHFPKIYEATALPVLKKRLTRLGITPGSIQQTLQDNPSIDPVKTMWLLAGVESMVVYGPNNRESRPEVEAIAAAIFKPILGERAPGSLFQKVAHGISDFMSKNKTSLPFLMLAGIDESELARKKLFESPMPATVILYNQIIGYPLPMDLNKRLDEERYDFFFMHGLEDNASLKIPMLDGLSIMEAIEETINAIGVRPAQLIRQFYPYLPETFLRVHAKFKEKQASLTWDDVKPELRKAFEDRGFKNAQDIARAINNGPGQKEIAGQLGIILRHNQNKQGFIVTPYDVLLALTEPQKARYAKGVATSLFHEKLHALTGGGMDFDRFYGLTTPEPQPIEQMTVAEFHTKVKTALGETPMFKNAVTEEQVAELLGIKPEEFRNFFEYPYAAYSLVKAELAPSPVMKRLEEKLGLSLKDEWKLIDDERRNREAARKQTNTEVVANGIAKPAVAVNTDCWMGIPASVAKTVRAKFETPGALAEEITRNIRADAAAAGKTNGKLPADVPVEDVTQALLNMQAGFAADGRPCELIHAQILRALCLSPKETARVLGCDGKVLKPEDVAKREVQAAIVDALARNPKLAHLLSWKQFKAEHPKADVADLVSTLGAAYSLRSQRETKPVLLPRASLVGVVDALNLGQPEMLRYQLDNIVTVKTWRAVAKTKMGRDPIPEDKARNGYELKLG